MIRTCDHEHTQTTQFSTVFAWMGAVVSVTSPIIQSADSVCQTNRRWSIMSWGNCTGFPETPTQLDHVCGGASVLSIFTAIISSAACTQRWWFSLVNGELALSLVRDLITQHITKYMQKYMLYNIIFRFSIIPFKKTEMNLSLVNQKNHWPTFIYFHFFPFR